MHLNWWGLVGCFILVQKTTAKPPGGDYSNNLVKVVGCFLAMQIEVAEPYGGWGPGESYGNTGNFPPTENPNAVYGYDYLEILGDRYNYSATLLEGDYPSALTDVMFVATAAKITPSRAGFPSGGSSYPYSSSRYPSGPSRYPSGGTSYPSDGSRTRYSSDGFSYPSGPSGGSDFSSSGSNHPTGPSWSSFVPSWSPPRSSQSKGPNSIFGNSRGRFNRRRGSTSNTKQIWSKQITSNRSRGSTKQSSGGRGKGVTSWRSDRGSERRATSKRKGGGATLSGRSGRKSSSKRKVKNNWSRHPW